MTNTQTLALFLRALDNPYQSLQRAEFYARAHAHRFSVTEFDAKNDADTQLHQIRDCLRGPETARPPVFFVNPVRESLLSGAAREAARLGVGWVSLNRSCEYVTELRREFANVPLLCVDPDQRQAGRLQGQQLRALRPSGGQVLYIHGPLSTSSARIRMGAFEAEISGSLLGLEHSVGDWSEESGFEAVKSWLRTHRNIQLTRWAIAAQNDSMAMGAFRALAEAAATLPGALTLPIAGCDGLPSYGQRFVSERKLSATIIVPPTAGTAVDEVASALNGGRAPTSDVALSVAPFPELDVLLRSTRIAAQRR